ncbi:hypothetical protein [Verrucomicrobium spinosum]|uniref:hypothetical protein n=1 Tax=Verrucomicrobium spinosum TaxID=2736 RepID=UPI00094673F2|nr:hypothetical protein [Verrucomicrobium spinosum]
MTAPLPTAPSSASAGRPRLAYLHSRYPVISQTFIDNEILGLEAAGWEVVVIALNPPKNDIRHPRLNGLKAPVLHAPPQVIRKEVETRLKAEKRWPEELIAKHAHLPGVGRERAEAACRNIAPFVDLLPALGVDHVHLHFANQATHSALFLKADGPDLFLHSTGPRLPGGSGFSGTAPGNVSRSGVCGHRVRLCQTGTGPHVPR